MSGTTDATQRLLAVARGEEPADLVLHNGRLANVFTGELEEGITVAVVDDRIAAVEAAGDPMYEGRRVVDLDGNVLAPGLIDAHVHIESSLVTPREFARAVIPRGTTTAITDPHEIANVHGIDGIRYMLMDSRDLPLSVFVMASSCVPATPMGTAGAELSAEDLSALAEDGRVLGLAELMNFPGAIHGDPGVLEKLAAFEGRVVDGHAPGVRGRHLSAYVAAGPRSDHECTSAEEALEKLRRGLWVFLREATNARNLRDLLPAITPKNRRRTALCTDDRQPADLLDEGGIDAMVRIAIESGVEPVDALRMATLNPADYFGLGDRGAVAPGRRADLILLEELDSFQVDRVWCGGQEVARRGAALNWKIEERPPPPPPSMAVDPEGLSFTIEPPSDMGREGTGTVRVIEVIPDQLVTGSLELEVEPVGDEIRADPGRDLCKIAVAERHTGSGRIGVGLVRGMGLRHGALAGTVAHDHHNLIVVGADDHSMETACRSVVAMKGGLAVARADSVLATLALPVGGLMSESPVDEVRSALDSLTAAARSLGSPLHDPFMALSFLGLEVIPSLKITDRGLVDVDRFELVDLWCGRGG